MKTTVGRIAFDSIFPPGYTSEYSQDKPLGNKEITEMLQRLAEEHPEKYREASHKVLRLGAKASVETGSSFSIKDLRWPVDKKKFMDAVEKEEREIFYDKSLSKVEKEKELIKLLNENAMKMPEITFDQGLEQGSTLAKMVASGARGNKNQLNQNVAASFLVVDQNNRPVPVGIKNSFAEGQKLHEYLAGGYGVRAGTIAGKFAVRDSGYLSKQVGSVAMDLLVTEQDCSTKNGISVSATDKDSIGSILARDTNGYKAGTMITPKILKDIQGRKTDSIVVRSAMTCQAGNGGICAHCAGVREQNKLPNVGDNIGLTAASSLGEPLSQALLGAKHSIIYSQTVLMSDLTEKRICDVQIGDWVMGADNEGNVEPAEVTDVICHGEEPVNRYDFRMGSTKKRIVSITCTDEHVILANRKVTAAIYKKTAEDSYYSEESRKLVQLKAGDKRKHIGIPMPVTVSKLGKPEEMAMLYGALLGDGIRWSEDHKNATPRISCADEEFASDLCKYLAHSGLEMIKCKRSYDWRISEIDKKNTSSKRDELGRYVEGSRSKIKDKIREWGLQGKYCHEKDIPMEFISGWDKNSLGELIAGYLATDGSISISGDGFYSIQFSSTSLPLLKKIQTIIEKVFCCYGSEIKISTSGKRKRILYNYPINRIDQVKKLLFQLPEIPGIKKHRAKDAMSQKYGRFNDDFFYRCPRIGSEFIGNEVCFDLTVNNKDNLFVLGNGIITHNSSGLASAKKVTGFKGINALFQVPDVYPNKSILSELDGEVTKIEELPQGGKNVYINDEPHYTPPNIDILVKPGAKLEAGDKITDGDTNPAEISRLRGLGEGRLSFVNGIRDIFDQNGVTVNRRNAEVVAKAVVDHVKIVDPDETSEYLPEDIVRYSDFEKSYQPRDNSYKSAPKTSVGKYLEAPALHYTIGTKITPRIADALDRNGDKELLVNDEEPAFVSNMVRVMDAPSYNGNWMAQLGTSYIQKNLKKNVLQTSEADIHGTHPMPALAYGKEFGQKIPGRVGY